MTVKNSLDALETYKNTGTLDVQGLSKNGTTVQSGANGTLTASEVVIVDASKKINEMLITDLQSGATPVHQVDPASCTISAAAGASNVATITIQLKDGAGNNLSRSIPFEVYAATDSTGLTKASAASTGFSVASGGASLNNGAAITTQIRCMSSATGGCVLSLTDTGKATSTLILVLPGGIKASAALTSGSYG